MTTKQAFKNNKAAIGHAAGYIGVIVSVLGCLFMIVKFSNNFGKWQEKTDTNINILVNDARANVTAHDVVKSQLDSIYAGQKEMKRQINFLKTTKLNKPVLTFREYQNLSAK